MCKTLYVAGCLVLVPAVGLSPRRWGKLPILDPEQVAVLDRALEGRPRDQPIIVAMSNGAFVDMTLSQGLPSQRVGRPAWTERANRVTDFQPQNRSVALLKVSPRLLLIQKTPPPPCEGVMWVGGWMGLGPDPSR